MMYKHYVFFLFSFCIVTGCDLDYEQARIVEEISSDIPDLISYDVTQTIADNGKPHFTVYADTSRTYNKKNLLVMENVVFIEYDEKMNIITQGQVDTLEYYTDTGDATLIGNIDFYSDKEQGSISGDYLLWDDEKRILEGKDEESVTITKDTGTNVSGKGFKADFKRKIVTFLTDVEGEYISNEAEAR